MRKRNLTIGLILFASMGVAAVGGTAWAHQEDAFEVPPPAEMRMPLVRQLDETEARQTLAGWQEFTQAEGRGWMVAQYRDDLGAPTALMGPGLALAGAAAGQRELIEAARGFAHERADLLNIDPSQLGREEVIDLNGKTQVIFWQSYQGLEVVGGRLEFFFDQGRVPLIGAEFYPEVRVGTTPSLNPEAARSAAIGEIPFNPVTDYFEADPRLVVFPLIQDGVPSYHLAYEVRFRTEDPVGMWWAYVDAVNGGILQRINHASTAEVEVTALTDIHVVHPYDPYTEMGNPYNYLRIDGLNYWTDENGYAQITVPLNQSYNVYSEIRGYYGNANRQDGTDANVTLPVSPSSPLTIKWNDSNSHQAERDGYYWMNETHSWIKMVDPAFSSLDYALPCNVNLAGTCNAFWNGGSISFYKEGGGCVNMATMGSVVIHEYAHGITQYTYAPSAPPNTSGMNEAFSDITPMNMLNDPQVGRGMHNGNGFIRSGENLRQYPATECGGQIHCLGEVLMGSMWKTRQNLIATHGYVDAVDLYSDLFRAAWKTKQYNMPNFLTRLLMADDDNANLGDGTPNWYEICDGFGMHNLPCPALTQYIQFTHAPLADQSGTSQPYEVTALIVPVNCGSLVTDSIEIMYSVDGGQNWNPADMTATGVPDQFRGYIPAQPCGSLVDYYIKASSTTGVNGTEPNRAPANHHRFMTGPATVVLDDNLESDLGWTLDPSDTATDGIWERVDPEEKINPINGELVQPGDDHTPGGTKCYVTNGTGGYYLNYDVDGGATTLLSPIYDLAGTSGAGNIEFWAFFHNDIVVDDQLLGSVSNDGGSTWTDLIVIEGTNANAWMWYKGYFSSVDLPFTSQMRFRIQTFDFNSSLTEAAVDDIVIRFTTCSGVDVEEGATAPVAFRLEQSRPNPMRDHTSIRFALPSAGPVDVSIFDASGRLVRNLDQGVREAGYHTVEWNGADSNGRSLSSGVYYYRVQTEHGTKTQKVMMVR